MSKPTHLVVAFVAGMPPTIQGVLTLPSETAIAGQEQAKLETALKAWRETTGWKHAKLGAIALAASVDAEA